MIGQDTAELGAIARVIRSGVTVVGTRKERHIRLPNVLFLDGARLLTDGLELVEARPLIESMDDKALLSLTGNISVAAGSPWGRIFGSINNLTATDGSFDGKTAHATVDNKRYWLGPVEHWNTLPEATTFRQRGNYVLELWDESEQQTVAILALRPRLAPGVAELVQICSLSHVELIMLASGDQIAAQALARRAGVRVLEDTNIIHTIRTRQQEGAIVAFVSDNSAASAAFAACDLAIGFIPRRNQLYARADLLAPDLNALVAIIEAGARRETTVRDSIGFSLISNIVGVVLRFTSAQNLAIASRTSFIASLGAIADGWFRMRGGERPETGLTDLVDPHPERWGQRSVAEVISSVKSSEEGLSTTEARKRKQQALPRAQRHQLLTAILDQVRSPLIGILAAGAGLSLVLGSVSDVAIIAFTILANVAVGSWQEYRADKMTETLQRIGTSSARVIRDGVITTIPATEVVVGDVLVLTHGDRLAADARVISAQGLEVDEAALTGESFPVQKMAEGGADSNHVVLAGSDVSSGTGRAVVVAAGRQTRMGATMAALAKEEPEHSPLGMRLTRMLRFVLPISVIGGAVVILTGLIWGQPLAPLLATGATIALAGVPEGLPLLTQVSEAGVARRLADRNALVRRLTAVEALGRVDIACTDKTGTLTRGRLALSLVANLDHETKVPGKLHPSLQYLLTTAAYASPHPDAPDAKSHPTDIAVIQGALDEGLEKQIHVKHDEEIPFDPRRAFHATMVQGRLCLKGAPEALIPRCSAILRRGKVRPLSDEDRLKLRAMSRQFAGRGLRMLFVAESTEPTSLDNPQGLTALGFVGISDQIRSTVQEAVRRCQGAGVRVIMITGDHPVTARAIAQETGLIDNSNGQVITGSQMVDLSNEELADLLEHTAVIARATPLDKVRIIDCLKLHGHTVAMTGDGVNDAPALRLADVGVAMGGGSTEVARQTADVVIANDDFSTLVETFVEGRSFWRNIRRSLGLLLGGNLGELGLVVGASLAGLAAPLNVGQILAMNAITDTLPAIAVALQQPEHRNLAELRREGTSALGRPLLYEMIRRAITSAIPSFIGYVLMLGTPGGLMEARAVAYTSIITTQLAQTLEVGRTERSLSRSVLAAVVGSAGVLAATLTIPPLRDFLSLVFPSPFGWAVIGTGTLLALLLSYVLDAIFARTIATTTKQAPVLAMA
jgi:calcium-translocating P-type ATPase